MSKLPNDFKQKNVIGGTSMGANTSFGKGKEPEHGHDGIAPFSKPSGSKGSVNKAVMSTKATVIGGTSMGK